MPRNWFTKSPLAFHALAAVFLVILAVAGCGSDNASGPVRYVPVTLKAMGVGGNEVAASGAGAIRGISELAAAVEADTLPVTFTQAYLVVRDVRFKISGEVADTTGGGETDSTDFDDTDSTGVGEDDDDLGQVRFHGPFVIDLLSGAADSLDTQMAPPALYSRVQGHLRALRAGDWNASSYDFLLGSTVYLEGTVDGEGGGPFVWQSRIDNEFQIWGRFEVLEDTPVTTFLTFDISKWLRSTEGGFLDPRIEDNDKWIRWAIRHNIKFHVDADHDGEPDDD